MSMYVFYAIVSLAKCSLWAFVPHNGYTVVFYIPVSQNYFQTYNKNYCNNTISIFELSMKSININKLNKIMHK